MQATENGTFRPEDGSGFWRRKWHGFMQRLAEDANYLVLAAPPQPAPPPPSRLQLVRLSQAENAALHPARTVMQAADEPDVVEDRLARGEMMFGWSSGTAMVSFGWATPFSRIIGMRPTRAFPGRIFLYNFATLSSWRGQGLYPALLQQIRYALGQDGAQEFLIDVDTLNLSSLRGVLKAGFLPVARVSFRTILHSWQLDRGHIDMNGCKYPVW
jgi:hypothetical protein